MTRLSEYLLPTEKQAPADAEAISHKPDGPRRADPPARRRPVDWLPAGWRVHQRVVADHPRGDGRDRRAGDADAACSSRPSCGSKTGPLRDRGAVQAARPQGLRARARDDPRGGGHHARRAGRALLPRPAADPLPLPGQGARRAAPARRGAAHARVHHEGLLQLRPRRRGPATSATSCTSAPTTASSNAPACAGTASRATSA